MPLFLETLRPTPFGYFDSDPLFQTDADKMVTFIMRRLGEDWLNVELTKHNVWANFEEAAMLFSAALTEYQFKSNLASIIGMPTGSYDPNTGLPTINLNNVYIKQNLSFLNDLAGPYAGSIGYGSDNESVSGSITLTTGVQDYDLYTDLKDNTTGVAIYNTQPSGSFTRLVVYDVFHDWPYLYTQNANVNLNYLGTGTAASEGYSVAGTRFYVLPLFEDVLRAQAMHQAQKIRRSHYSYRISGRHIRIFPTPSDIVAGYNDKLWLRVGFRQSPLPTIQDTLVVSGTVSTVSGSGNNQYFLDQTIYGVNGPFNAPYGPVAYKTLNIWAKNWIAQMTLAISTEQLGNIRNKVKSFPVAGEQLSLNGQELVTMGREDKEKLTTSLKETLDALSFDKIQEREATKAEMMVKQLAFVPVNPKYALFMG